MSFLTLDKVDEVGANTGPDKKYLAVTKLQEDKEYKLRFFGEGATGYEGWTVANKPLRWPLLPSEIPSNIRTDDNGAQVVKFFIAGIVWDYDQEIFRVINITQKTILDQLHKYMKDEDYGDLNGYDVTITKTGSGMQTKYRVLAKPPKAPSASIKEGFSELTWKINNLFQNINPWDDAPAAEAPSSVD